MRSVPESWGLEAAIVRGECCEFVGAIRSHERWQSISVNARSEPLWLERQSSLLTVGIAYFVRKASDTRITLVKKRCAWSSHLMPHKICTAPLNRLKKEKRCAWYLRVKLKPPNELPYIKREEFLEAMSMDQRAGVGPVDEGGELRQRWSSSS